MIFMPQNSSCILGLECGLGHQRGNVMKASDELSGCLIVGMTHMPSKYMVWATRCRLSAQHPTALKAGGDCAAEGGDDGCHLVGVCRHVPGSRNRGLGRHIVSRPSQWAYFASWLVDCALRRRLSPDIAGIDLVLLAVVPDVLLLDVPLHGLAHVVSVLAG